jgi:hypothetical protein
MTSRIKRLLVLPVVAALYFVHPALGFFGLAGGFVGVLYMQRVHDGMPSVAHEDGITNAFLS